MRKNVNQKKKRKPVLFFVIFIIVIAACGTTTYFYLNKSNTTPTSPDETKIVTEEPEAKEPDPTYITETCYDGSQELDPVLYSISFDTGEGEYIKNKDIVKEINEDEILLLQQKAEECVQLLFGTNDSTILADYENTEIDLVNLFQREELWYDENDAETIIKLYMADYLKTLADNNYKAICKFQTDKSLIWYNNCYFVRGLVQLDVQECKDGNALLNYFPVVLETGKSYQMIIDFGFTRDVVNGTREYIVTEIEYKLAEETRETVSDPELLEIKG